jgi:RND superfamily putative drug exporter
MRKRAWLRPALVVGMFLVWIGIAGVGNSFFSKLSDEVSQDPAAFLPKSAESTLASAERDLFVSQDVIPVVVVLDGVPR